MTDLARRVVDMVARAQGVTADAILSSGLGSARVAAARQMSMYLLHVVFSLPMSDVGRAFGRDRTTVAHACATIEDLRDDASFDARVMALEEEAASLSVAA